MAAQMLTKLNRQWRFACKNFSNRTITAERRVTVAFEADAGVLAAALGMSKGSMCTAPSNRGV